MKLEVEIITARLNGKLIFAEAIQDCYTNVQVILKKEDLDEDTIDTLRRVEWYTEFDDSFNLGECEAKNVCGQYGNLNIWLETKTIEIEDMK